MTKSVAAAVALLSAAFQGAPSAPKGPAPAGKAPPVAANKKVAAEPAAPPTRLGQDVTAEFDVPEGLEVRVWAESPQFFNPTNIDVDAQGRVWVTEGVNYRTTIRQHGDKDGYLAHPQGDRVVILEDTNQDGVADSSKVFVEDKDLQSPLGIGVFGNRVLVSSSPNVFAYTDTDGDGKSEKKELFLSGFGGFDHDHGVHAFTFGPDGRLYFATGNHGPHIVKDKNGWTLRSTKEGPSDSAQKSDDGRVWVQGLTLRINPDGTGLGVVAHNFRNDYENTVDAFGNVWQNDNDDDGNQGCRMTFVLEGGSYGYASLNGQRGWRADQRAGQPIPVAHWHLEDPGTVPPTEITGAGSPTGIAVYEGKLLPAKFYGMVLNSDAGRSSVFGHIVRPNGAGYSSERINFLASKASLGDEARRYRPSDVAVGPDGAVYVADWYDPVVGGHNMRDKRGIGRIFRIAPKGNRPSIPRLDTSTPEGAVEALLSPAVNVRALGWQALAAQGEKALPALKAKSADGDARVRARVLWPLARMKGGKPVVVKALADGEADVRIAAFRALRAAEKSPQAVLPYVKKLQGDSSPAVRRELAVALRDVPAAQAVPALAALAAAYQGQDRLYVEALGIGAQGKEEALYTKLAAAEAKVEKKGKADPLAWSPVFTDLAWRLHPASSVPAWRTRAEAPSLSNDDRQRALVALAFIPTADAAKAVLAVAEKGGDPLKSYALDLAFDRAGAEWKPFKVAEAMAAAGLTKPRGGPDAHLEGFKVALFKPDTKPEVRAKAVEALARDKEGGNFLVGLAVQKKLSPELSGLIAEHIFQNPDVSVRALASQYFKRPAFDGVEFPAVPELLKMKGDAKKGREVFFSNTAACSQCHEYGGQGKSVGPSLSLIAGKLGRDAIFDAILNPSAGIAFGYDPWVITTKDQQTYTGFILGDGDNVLLKDVSGENRMIAAREIVQREKQKTSIMPDNIALGMKPQQLVDLVEFLASGPKTAPGASATGTAPGASAPGASATGTAPSAAGK